MGVDHSRNSAKREPNSNGDAEAKQPEVEALIA